MYFRFTQVRAFLHIIKHKAQAAQWTHCTLQQLWVETFPPSPFHIRDRENIVYDTDCMKDMDII